MATSFDDLKVLRDAEAVADEIWQQVVGWDLFAREVVGGQLARAAGSIGANIAEAFGRFHYGEKLQFLYYARGSTKAVETAPGGLAAQRPPPWTPASAQADARLGAFRGDFSRFIAGGSYAEIIY